MNRIRVRLAALVSVAVVVALVVTMTGSGALGPVQGGWSVSEDCTPHVPGDTSGSVGAASLSAGVTATSRYAAENRAQLTHEGSSWYGNVASVSEAGLTAGVQMDGRLGFAVADVVADPVWFRDENNIQFLTYGSGVGQVADPRDIAIDPVDGSVFVASSGSVDGVERHRIIKFDTAGNYVTEFGSFGTGNGQLGGIAIRLAVAADQSVWVADGWNNRLQKFTRTNATTYTYALKTGTFGTGNGQFAGVGPNSVAVDAAGNVYAGDPSNGRIQKFNSSGTYQAKVSIQTAGSVLSPTSMGFDNSTGTLWAATNVNLSTPTTTGTVERFDSSLNPLSAVAIPTPAGGTLPGIRTLRSNNDGTFWVSWYETTFLVKYGTAGTELGRWQSNYPTNAAGFLNVAVSSADYGFVLFEYANWYATTFGSYAGRYVVGFDYRPVSLSRAVREYLETCDPNLGGLSYSYTASADPNVVFGGFTGNMWAKLKELLTLYSLELVVIGDTITVRDIGSESLKISNNTPVRTTPTVSSRGQKIIATVQNPKAGGGVMWDAATTSSNYSVPANTTVAVDVVTPNYPVSLAFPTPVDTLPLQSGQYYVVDSNGTHVPTANWIANGGNVQAILTGPQQIRLIFTGAQAIVGYTAPFYFATGRTPADTPALTIGGNGVRVDPVTVPVYTPADPTQAQEVAYNINSPFLDTLERCYNRLAWAAEAAAGPSVEIQFDLPTKQLGNFGQKLGALVTWQSSIYRVMRIQRRALTSTITATRYVKMGDLDTAWSGQTIGTRDTFWSGYSAGDRLIQPVLTSR